MVYSGPEGYTPSASSTETDMKQTSYSIQKRLARITGLADGLYRWPSRRAKAFHKSRFMVNTRGKLKRFWMVHFRKSYVREQLAAREGACRQCGTCCNLLFSCPMLTKDSLCRVYGTCRPEACKVFPIEQLDIDEVKLCGGQCGYSFKKKDSDKVLTAHKS